MSEAERQEQHRLLGRIDLLIRRRPRHVGGQTPAGLGDGRLNILRGGVDVAASVNCTVICVVPCEFVELMLCMPAMVENWRSSGVATDDGHGLRTGARQRGGHLDGRVVDAGQRRHRQRAERHDAEQQNGEHDQRRHDRTFDEDAGDVHGQSALD